MKQHTPDQIRNVAVVGHGGSGKTMLVEHLLYTTSAIERVGSVDAGNTQSDFDPLENKRKISISASVLPTEWKGHKINFLDVPGFPDFIGDLHAVGRVADAMLIVCEAKKDIDVGFELAWEVADKHHLPRGIFVNKLERDNADYEGLLETLRERYGNRIVEFQLPVGKQASFSGVVDLVDGKAHIGKDRGDHSEPVPANLQADAEALKGKLVDSAAEADDDLMMKYLEGEELSPSEIQKGIAAGVLSGHIVPVFVGSATSGIGCAPLLDHIIREFPSAVSRVVEVDGNRVSCDPAGPLAAFVFKTTADPFVGKINYLRVFRGTLKADDVLSNVGRETNERMHNLFFPRGKSQEPASVVVAGDICGIAKLQDTHTSDSLCHPKTPVHFAPVEFPETIYRVAIKPATKADEDKMGSAIGKLLDEDPTLQYERAVELHQEVLLGMGDIHLDTAIDKLKSRFGVTVSIEDAKVPYRETIKGTAKAQGRHKRQTGGKGQFGDCWIEMSPLPRGAGFVYESAVVGGSIPKNFIPAIEKGILETISKGYLAGYPVQDFKVVVYDGSYHDVDSSEQAFKTAGSIAFKNAIEKCTPIILEPVMQLAVDVPDECVGDVVGDLNTRRGQMQGMEPVAPGKTRINASVPMATMMRYALDLRSITKGRGRFRAEFARYDELPHNEAQKLIAEYNKRRAEEQD